MDIAEGFYDAQAVAGAGQTRRERAEGPAGALKKYHNAVKRALLGHFVTPGDTLLDLACGRGGDLHKWADVGVARVVGVDISSRALEQAHARYHALRPPFAFETHHVTTLKMHPWTCPHAPLDIATCMFALHYFFESEASARTFLHTVASNLKKGGYFLCVLPDASCINRWLMEGTTDDLLRLEPQWSGPPKPFGSAYTCSIADTVTESGSPEYLVYENVLLKLAATLGLDPVYDVDLPCLQPAPRRLFKPFLPRLPASSVFVACVLRRR